MKIYCKLPKGAAIFHKHSTVFKVSYICDLVRNIDLIGSQIECVICKELVKKSSEGAVLYEKGAKSINEVRLQRGDDIKANVGESVHIKCRKNYVKQRNIEAAKMKQLQPGESVFSGQK